MTWGNPKAASFEKRHIRMVVVDHHRVKVHRLLADVVERILLDLAAQGLTASTSGWEPGDDGRNVDFDVHGLDPERTALAMKRYGFTPTSSPNVFRWADDEPPEQSDEPEDVESGDNAANRTPITKPVVPKALEGTERLGSRDLTAGMEGADVLTLQAFLGAPRTGVFDEFTERAVRLFHERKGFTCDGSMPLASQCWIIPRTVERLRTGAAGLTVMLLSSALIAKQVLPMDAAVSTRYTVALADVVRSYKESIGLPRTEVVDSPTWASLVDQPRRG